MTFAGRAWRCALFSLLGFSLGGCLPGLDNQLDEKREPHYIAGENLVEQRDYKGAIGEFEKSLEVNSRSASAHFDLAWLYEQQMQDPAAAIYHYDRYLKYSPNPDKADLAKQHINLCKLELAKSVAATGTLAAPAQREIERLDAQSRDLQTQVATLKEQLAQAKADATKAAQQSTANYPAQTRAVTETPHHEPLRTPANSNSYSSSITSSPSSTRGTARTHLVKSSETIASIARKYGVSIAALEAANPKVKPTHLSVGQTLNIPGQ